MKITPAQARQAFYQAAANIEAHPDSYDYTYGYYHSPLDSTCMVGHAGRALGYQKMTPEDVCMLAEDLGIHPITPSETLYPFDSRCAFEAAGAARAMRAFADHHWPEGSTEPVRPDLVECGLSFGELMDSLGVSV